MCTSQKDMVQEEENRKHIIMLENEVRCSHEDIMSSQLWQKGLKLKWKMMNMAVKKNCE